MFVVLSVAFFNFKRCLKQLIVLKYMLITNKSLGGTETMTASMRLR